MIRAYDDYGNVIDMVEHDKQIRANTIDEIIDKFSIPSNSGLEREIHLDVRELKQLKEQN